MTTDRITLSTDAISVEILTAGASVRQIRLPGIAHSPVVGAADPSVYGAANRTFFLGASVGRYANRIDRGRFRLGNEEHQLSQNETPNHLHGGTTGLWSRDWRLVEADERHAMMAITSPDGEDGYPGNAELRATFAVDAAGTLSISYEATCDRPSIVNLTAHLYFDMSGTGMARDDILTIAADAYLPVDAALIPTGEIADVAGTSFDFRKARRLADGPPSLDHNFCLDGGSMREPRAVARLESAASGLALVLETTEPGLQVYDGVAFDGSVTGIDGRPIGRYGGIALEPQAYPDSPNRPGFPSAVLRPGETYHHVSRYRFERS